MPFFHRTATAAPDLPQCKRIIQGRSLLLFVGKADAPRAAHGLIQSKTKPIDSKEDSDFQLGFSYIDQEL
jgi:hypothetical protein